MSSSDVDFVSAARSFASGRADAALMVLLPCQLAEHELQRRVHQLVAVGAVLTGAMTSSWRPGGVPPDADPASEPVHLLTAHFLEAGARLDSGAIKDLLAAHSTQALVDVLVELVVRFAALGPARPALTAPGLRPDVGGAR